MVYIFNKYLSSSLCLSKTSYVLKHPGIGKRLKEKMDGHAKIYMPTLHWRQRNLLVYFKM